MHIDTLYESQAIKLLHDVCNALGIEQQDRTREVLRDKLSAIELGAFVHAMTQEISPPCTACEAFTVHGGDKLKISVRLASEAESGVLSAAYGKTGPGWVDDE